MADEIQRHDWTIARGESRDIVYDFINEGDESDYDLTDLALECQFRPRPGDPNLLASPAVEVAGTSQAILHVTAQNTRHLPNTVRFDIKATHMHDGSVKVLVEGQITVTGSVTQ